MRQTLAIFLDAYRELNSKKLFWISLAISLVVVIALALPTQLDRGITVFGAKLEGMPFALVGSKAISASAFYKFLYSWFGINLWLGWGATILALVSTASMIPDLVSSGSIELTLAKPLGRLRLFLTKYTAGLLFVALQAGVFALGAIAIIGFRSGVWDARPLFIVPIMAMFFSFLHCISVLVGLLTRSTLMSLIAVIIMWLGFWAIGSVENIFLAQRTDAQGQVTQLEDQQKTFRTALDLLQQQIDRTTPTPTTAPQDKPNTDVATPTVPAAAATEEPSVGTDKPNGQPARRPGARRSTSTLLDTGKRMLSAATDTDPDSLRVRKQKLQAQIDALDTQIAARGEDLASTVKWHGRLYAVYSCVPKTGETKDLFQRWVIDKSDWDGFLKMLSDISDSGGRPDPQDALNKRPLWWVLGTSFAFEGLILGIACWIFCRRDF